MEEVTLEQRPQGSDGNAMTRGRAFPAETISSKKQRKDKMWHVPTEKEASIAQEE
jgi:hypothetical protein